MVWRRVCLLFSSVLRVMFLARSLHTLLSKMGCVRYIASKGRLRNVSVRTVSLTRRLSVIELDSLTFFLVWNILEPYSLSVSSCLSNCLAFSFIFRFFVFF